MRRAATVERTACCRESGRGLHHGDATALAGAASCGFGNADDYTVDRVDVEEGDAERARFISGLGLRVRRINRRPAFGLITMLS